MAAHPVMTLEPQGDRAILVTRNFAAPPQAVFDAHVQPALLRRWLYGPPDWTMPVCEIDARPGGRFRYLWRSPEGQDMGVGGTVVAVSAPHRMEHTELFEPDWTGGEATVSTAFDAAGQGTAMTMVVRYSGAEARDNVLASPMKAGMEMSYDRLDDLLAETARS